MFISGPQIRAARGMLDWSVTELGAKAGVGATTISAIERGKIDGSKEVLMRIYDSVRAAGLVFTENGGVEPNKHQITVLEGRAGFAAFYDDVYAVASNGKEPDICITNVDERKFIYWHGEFAPPHVERMKALKIQPVRILVEEGDRRADASPYSVYQWLPKQYFMKDISLYIYGEKAGIVDFRNDNVSVTLFTNSAIVQMLRHMFEALWMQSMAFGDAT